jgi:hypothetical protein
VGASSTSDTHFSRGEDGEEKVPLRTPCAGGTGQWGPGTGNSPPCYSPDIKGLESLVLPAPTTEVELVVSKALPDLQSIK